VCVIFFLRLLVIVSQVSGRTVASFASGFQELRRGKFVIAGGGSGGGNSIKLRRLFHS